MPDEWFGTQPRFAGTRLQAAHIVEALAADIDGLAFSIGTAVTPIVLPRSSYDELFSAAVRLLALLRRAGFDVAATRRGRLAAHGVTEEDWPLFLADDELERRYSACIARADVIVGADGPRFIEFNVSGAVGGVIETHALTHGWRRVQGSRDGTALDGPDPLDARAALYESVCADLGRPPAVAVVAAVRTLWSDEPSTRYLDVEVEFLRRRGWLAEHFEPERLPSALRAGGRLRFPVGLRYLTIAEWREHGISLEPVREALRAGCVLLAPQSSYFVADKRVLAWLSAGTPWMTAADAAFVGRYVPWTRVVADAPAGWRGARHELPRLLLEQRERFVLKTAFSMQGQGMTIGRECSDRAWDQAVADALARDDVVVQEYVEPARCDVDFVVGSDGAIETVAMAPVLSPLVIGHRAAGCYVRYLPGGAVGITSAVRFGAIKNVAFRGR